MKISQRPEEAKLDALKLSKGFYISENLTLFYVTQNRDYVLFGESGIRVEEPSFFTCVKVKPWHGKIEIDTQE